VMLETVYLSYHGVAEGLAELRTKAASAAFPPAEFAVESKESIAERRRKEEMARAQPDPSWSELRKRLEAPDGATYFAENLRDKPLPKLKGTLARFSAQDLVLAMEAPGVEDLILKLTAPLSPDPMPGQAIEFEGLGESFTAIPFLLMVKADPSKIVR
jgi:hypothetical protein